MPILATLRAQTDVSPTTRPSQAYGTGAAIGVAVAVRQRSAGRTWPAEARAGGGTKAEAVIATGPV